MCKFDIKLKIGKIKNLYLTKIKKTPNGYILKKGLKMHINDITSSNVSYTKGKVLLNGPKDKFLEAWNQKSEGLELIKGQVMDENHIIFAQDNTVFFWTTKGIGLISIISLIQDTSPYKLFIPTGMM